MASETTGRESDKFMLRLPDGMRDRLKAVAEENKRSMNAEIVIRLEQSLLPKSVQIDDYLALDIRAMIWKEMYNCFHKYRSNVIESVERKLSRDQPTLLKIEEKAASDAARRIAEQQAEED